MSFKKSIALISASILAAFFPACNVSDPEEHHEEELITSVRLVYTHAGGGSDTVWFRDADGPGGGAPTEHDTIRLLSGRSYSVALSLLNESNPSDVVDITAEILEEADEHQVFYTVSGSGLSVSVSDQDGNGLPVGLSTTQTATSGTPGTLTVTLKHQPGLKSASSTITTGETDVEVAFVVMMLDISMLE